MAYIVTKSAYEPLGANLVPLIVAKNTLIDDKKCPLS